MTTARDALQDPLLNVNLSLSARPCEGLMVLIRNCSHQFQTLAQLLISGIYSPTNTVPSTTTQSLALSTPI